MCPTCSLDFAFKEFQRAWAKNDYDDMCFAAAEDENGVRHTFREALFDFVKQTMPKEFDWSIHSEQRYVEDVTYFYVEARNTISTIDRLPYYFVFTVEA